MHGGRATSLGLSPIPPRWSGPAAGVRRSASARGSGGSPTGLPKPSARPPGWAKSVDAHEAGARQSGLDLRGQPLFRVPTPASAARMRCGEAHRPPSGPVCPAQSDRHPGGQAVAAPCPGRAGGGLMAPPRKVLMTADCVGGVWTYALQLAAELGKRSIEVTLVVMGGKPSPDQAADAARLRNLHLIGTDFRLEWMSAPEADLRLAGELLLELEAEQRPDLVHLNGYCHAALPFSAPVLVAAHSCVPSWWRACRGT